MSRKSKRRVTQEEESLWKRAIENTARLKPEISVSKILIDPLILKTKPKQSLFSDFRMGEKAPPPKPVNILAQPFRTGFNPTSSNMDKRNFDRLKKGKMNVDGRIDLHGMTLAQAHPALDGFVRRSHADGKRLLLVITGKGRTGSDMRDGMYVQRGILRQQVPQWLGMGSIAPMILQVVQATQKHGGEGAYYVYLRRSR